MDCVKVSNGKQKPEDAAAGAGGDGEDEAAAVRLAEKHLQQLLGQLSAVGDDQQNAAIVEQVFGLVLGQPDRSVLSAQQFGVLEAFATELASSEQPVAAHACFEHLLRLQQLQLLHHHQQQQQQPTNSKPPLPPSAPTQHLNRLRTAHNLDNVRHQLVERWHFRMLNDRQRNRSYRAAIQSAVADYRHRSASASATAMRVLDIGTGTGLLAMYAHQAGAGAVFACDESPVMADIAARTFARCSRQPPPVIIREHSTRLVAGDLRKHEPPANGVDATGDPRVDLIVTETLDAGAFGEGILQTLLHAHQHLLRPGGRVIPAAVQLYIAGFESRTVALEQVGLNMDFGDVVYMRGSQLRAKNGAALSADCSSEGSDCLNGSFHSTGGGSVRGEVGTNGSSTTTQADEPYDSDTVHNIRDFRLLTRIEPAFACDFQNAEDIRSALSGEREESVTLQYTQVGHLDGFVVWFRLQLDTEHSLCTAPPDEALKAGVAAASSASASASTAPASTPVSASCWEQAVFKLNARFANGERLQSLNVGISCAGGRLQLQHYYSGNSRRAALAVPPDTVRFVNDAEYLTRLEYEFNAAAKQSSPSSVAALGANSTGNILDLCPFPHIGFSLLKDRAARRLYCSADTAELLRFVAAANCVDAPSALHFVHGLAEVWQLPADVRFDAILLAPVSGELGVLDAEQVRAYDRLRRERLAEGGRMVPHRVEVWGQLVRSEWLQRVTRVVEKERGVKPEEDDDDELVQWGIATAMNRFATRQQLGLGFFEHDCVSGAFRVANVRWGEGGEDERYVLVRLPAEVAERDLHGMLCFYKVWLMPESEEPISTRRFASHVRRMCFVLDAEEVATAAGGGKDDAAKERTAVPPRMTSRAVVQVRQHDGLLECSLYRRGQGGSGKCAVLSNGNGGGGAGGGQQQLQLQQGGQ